MAWSLHQLVDNAGLDECPSRGDKTMAAVKSYGRVLGMQKKMAQTLPVGNPQHLAQRRGADPLPAV